MGIASAPKAVAAAPPPPSVASQGVLTAAQNQVNAGEAAAGTFGASGTVLTGPQGLVNPPTTANKKLTGL